MGEMSVVDAIGSEQPQIQDSVDGNIRNTGLNAVEASKGKRKGKKTKIGAIKKVKGPSKKGKSKKGVKKPNGGKKGGGKKSKGKKKKGKRRKKGRKKRRKKKKKVAPRKCEDMLDPSAMENLYYVAHNLPEALKIRKFTWKKKGKRRRRKGKK